MEDEPGLEIPVCRRGPCSTDAAGQHGTLRGGGEGGSKHTSLTLLSLYLSLSVSLLVSFSFFLSRSLYLYLYDYAVCCPLRLTAAEFDFGF